MGYNYASTTKRFYAFLIDSLLTLTVMTIPTLVISLFYENEIVHFIVAELLRIGFLFLQLKIFKGATVGKMVFKLKILDAETGCQPSDVALLKRLFSCYMGMSILSEIMTVAGICYVSLGMALGRKDGANQSLWDKIANTVVIDESGR